jgi:hypothetical protein
MSYLTRLSVTVCFRPWRAVRFSRTSRRNTSSLLGHRSAVPGHSASTALPGACGSLRTVRLLPRRRGTLGCTIRAAGVIDHLNPRFFELRTKNR